MFIDGRHLLVIEAPAGQHVSHWGDARYIDSIYGLSSNLRYSVTATCIIVTLGIN